MTAVLSMADVGREAGFSAATVSRVLSGRTDGIRPSTAAAVIAAAERLGYRYNGVAAALRRQRTMMIGVVVPRIANPYFSALVEALERSLTLSGFDLLLGDAQETASMERTRIESLLDRRVDALVVIPTDSKASGPALAMAAERPLVQLDRRVRDVATDWVGVDHRGAIRSVVGALRRRGHRRLAFIGADGSTSANERCAGFCEAAPGMPVLLNDFSMDWGDSAMREIHRAWPEVTGVVCANDLIAYGAIRACQDLDLDIPGDVAITGFDDLPFSSLIAPGLTTIRQPIRRLAEITAKFLLGRLNGQEWRGPTEVLVPCELIKRQSI